MSERDVPMQGIHTNNFTESYHRVLKYNFLSRHTLRRPDDLLQTLVDKAEPDFRQSVLTTTLGFRPQRATKYQNIAKGLLETYSNSDLADLGVSIQPYKENKWTISSFTRPMLATYTVNTTPPKDGKVGYVNNCNCTHFLKNKSSCKHMYVLTRQTGFNILETNPEVDDGSSPFEFRRIVEPFNIVVRTLTNVHPDTPPPSPPINPYRSSAGIARTPSTTGLPIGSFCYAPMVPAPLPYIFNGAGQTTTPANEPNHHQQPPLHAPAPIAPPNRGMSVTSDQWLHDTTNATTRSAETSSDSYIGRLFYDPNHLQSTPPSRQPAVHAVNPPRQTAAPYPTSPLGRDIARTQQRSAVRSFELNSPQLNLSFNTSQLTCGSTNVTSSTIGSPSHRRHFYTSNNANAASFAPPPPPPTQMPYQLDYNLLQRALQSTSTNYPSQPGNRSSPAPQPSTSRQPMYHPPQPSTSRQPMHHTPEITPAPVTTSQIDGLLDKMDRGRQPSAPRDLNRREVTNPATGASSHQQSANRPHGTTNPAPFVTEGPHDGLPLTTTSQAAFDTGPSVLSVAEEDALRAFDRRLFKRKEDFAAICSALRAIHHEAPFADEGTNLLDYNDAFVAAMRAHAEYFLSRLRIFNSTNRPTKQNR
ncbi:uncharacterized protein MELLADRAFT_60661 [Melampsora larici-populina 98AG31]|uniref:SWIM-type domain-containing protein n=1 Tax=Melampsora larici-populina (strain 98AG31 / pathotype 3-4-7) TaxID=747676 RepID=F4RBW0_MELLP|nr:uncharacterized protein MELLADRAFT_60661 [Melampsora larici-populina 98AG31]EGG10273.1 hypothetical protein MELLADRAFT_60661 [Melampsora larici-populina 98AG31]